ncbi:MAG: VWA domain-containing protein [Chitinophagaceae bacterium]|nr:VWA domain-containing protein [Chitinophagaceae bacterium]
MFNFQYIEYFIFLAAVPFLLLFYFLVINWKKKAILKIGDRHLVKQLIKNYSPKRFATKFILILISFVTIVFALTNLRSNQGSEKIIQKGIDVVIALDVSKSMLAQDIKPTRLDRAKQLLNKLVDKLGNNRIGLVIFAGKAYLQMPLTVDHRSAKMFINAVNTDAVPTQCTVISDALKMCSASFNTKEKKYKSVILISDGEDHDENAAKITGQMANEGIVIHTVGIGSPQGSTIFDSEINEVKKDENGNTVITKLNEKELSALAKKGNGLYQLYSNTDEVVSKLADQLNNMDQKVYTSNSSANYKSYFQFFLLISLLLLVIEIFISEKKKIKTRNVIKPVAASHQLQVLSVIIILIAPLISFAQNAKVLIKKGNEAYSKNEFNTAIKNYKTAADKNPSNVTAQYNLGNALYKNKKNPEAIQAYDNVLQSASNPLDKAKAYYNKGVVLQNDNKLNECIEAYKNALKLVPGDDDARQNLQKALQQQKQQEQQKKEQKDKQEKQPDKDDSKEKEQKPNEEDKDKKNGSPEPQQQPKLSKQDAEEKLKALQQHEKNLQDKLRKVNASSSNKPAKDW